MKIVVLDGFTLNPGDLDWKPLRELGQCEIHDRTPGPEILFRAKAADILLTNKTPLNRELLEELPALQYIGVLATGTNVVDLVAARERGIPVTNVPAYGTSSVAQHTFALLLELTHRVGAHAQGVREGHWSHNRDWCYWESPLVELEAKTLGIVGFGRIGRQVATVASAFGMRVLAFNPNPKPIASFVQRASLAEVFRDSDVVSLHCPLTPETRELVNAQTLALMKPSAFLLNTSRGLLVDEPALAEALNSGKLAGAGLDVLSVEPPTPTNPLLTARNCIITPHMAWGTCAARARLLAIAIENIQCFLSGTPSKRGERAASFTRGPSRAIVLDENSGDHRRVQRSEQVRQQSSSRFPSTGPYRLPGEPK